MKFKNKYIVLFYFVIAALLTNAQSTPIMYFPFNGNSQDETGNGNNATNYGATLTTDRFGNTNSAYLYDGIDDFMEIIPVSDLSAVGDFTVSLWIQFNGWAYPINPPESISNIEESKYIFNGHARSSTATNDFYREGMNIIAARDVNDVEYLNTGTVYTYTPSITYYRTVNELPNISEWKHIVYKRESGVFKTFINGQIATISFANGTIDLSNQLDMIHAIYLGTFSGNNPNLQYAGTYNYKGKIDDVSFYKTSISDQDLLKLYYKDTYTPLVIAGVIQEQTNRNVPNGSIELNLNGGVEPYTFEWSNGEGIQNIYNLQSGVYNIKVTDALGIEYFNSFTVLQNIPADTLSISGFVTVNDIGIENSLVELYSIQNQEINFVSQILTDEFGNFNFSNLFSNEYILIANPSGNFIEEYIPTYYFDSDNKENAIIISLEGQVSHLHIPLLVKTGINSYEEQNIFKVFNSIVFFNPDYTFTVFQNNGKIVFKGVCNYIDFNFLPNGLYIIMAQKGSFQTSIQFFNKN